MNELHNFPFALQMYGFEAKVRGLYLTIACDIERMMCDVIAKCEVEAEIEREAFKLKLPFEMGAKLKRCKEALEKYNKAYFDFFIPQFDAIEQLCKYRNMLAHGFSEYDDNKVDKTFIIFKWVESAVKNPGEKTERVSKTEKILIRPFINQMNHYRDHVLQFMKLIAKLSEERGAK